MTGIKSGSKKNIKHFPFLTKNVQPQSVSWENLDTIFRQIWPFIVKDVVIKLYERISERRHVPI